MTQKGKETGELIQRERDSHTHTHTQSETDKQSDAHMAKAMNMRG